MYQYLCPIKYFEESDRYNQIPKLVFLKAIVDPDWKNSKYPNNNIKIKKDNITWAIELDYKDALSNSKGLIIEGNIHYINFDINHFIITYPPKEYEHLVSDKYKLKKYKRKNLEL